MPIRVRYSSASSDKSPAYITVWLLPMNAIVGYGVTPGGPRSFGPASAIKELLKMAAWSRAR